MTSALTQWSLGRIRHGWRSSRMTNEHDSGRRINRVASMAGLIGVAAATVAGAAIWLVLTEPVTIANAVDTGELAPLVRRLAEVIYQAMAGLLHYL
jgi:hypothetical protein